MAKSTSSLIENYTQRARSGFIAAVDESHTNQIAVLASLVDADFDTLSNITLGELFPEQAQQDSDGEDTPAPKAAATPRPSKKPPPKPAPKAATKAATPPKPDAAKPGAVFAFSVTELNLRVEGDREKFDAIVVEALNKARGTEGMHDLDGDGVPWVKSMTVRDLIKDCEAGPLRTCLSRLVENDTVVSTGKAAGTKYALVADA